MMISFAGRDMELLPEGGLWLPDVRVLCVADMHFEKDSFFAKFATFLPPYGSLETLHKLETLVKKLQPELFISAGDSFHDRDAASRLPPDLVIRLNSLIDGVPRWHWVTGNHDPHIGNIIHGIRSEELEVGGICFRHKTVSDNGPEVSGHYHPKIRFQVRGHTISSPCFIRQNNKLLLPAFGQYTGGLSIDSAVLRGLFPPEKREIFIAHNEKVFTH